MKNKRRVKEAGVDRYNHNLNTSERYHNEVVTTHTYEDRVRTVEIMKESYLAMFWVICGMGETNEDIIDMAFALREIDADSIPINFLHQLKGQNSGTRFIVTNEMFKNYCDVSID